MKHTNSGDEFVYIRNFKPAANITNPRFTYPYISNSVDKYIVPIYPEYHTELFPDSILRTESPNDFIENRPNRNAISKVYISRSIERGMKAGDIIVFYRTQDRGPAYYTAVTSTIGVVQDVVLNIPSLPSFIRQCRKRSVFSDDELAEHWNYKPHNRPFIVNFLYVYSFPKRLNRQALLELGVINDAPRGFERIDNRAFQILMEKSDADQRLIIN